MDIIKGKTETVEVSKLKTINLQKPESSDGNKSIVLPKGILLVPHKDNKKSSLILPSKDELKIRNNEHNEYKPFARNHSLLRNPHESPIHQYNEFAKISRSRSTRHSDNAQSIYRFERSLSYKKKQKEVKKYSNNQRIDSLIYDSVLNYGRDEKVANQWIAQLNRQEIFTISDIRSLNDDDWYHLGLSVLAIRAIKDTLYYI
ncbi:hypothetical protein BCR32DRAFT_324733, partial [Anaeromyces robustus]